MPVGGNSCQKFISEFGCGGGRDAQRTELAAKGSLRLPVVSGMRLARFQISHEACGSLDFIRPGGARTRGQGRALGYERERRSRSRTPVSLDRYTLGPASSRTASQSDAQERLGAGRPCRLNIAFRRLRPISVAMRARCDGIRQVYERSAASDAKRTLRTGSRRLIRDCALVAVGLRQTP